MSPIKRITGVVLWLLAIGLILEATINLLSQRRIQLPDSTRSYDASNLKQIALALYTYCDVHGELPPANVTDKAGKPLYSWRVFDPTVH